MSARHILGLKQVPRVSLLESAFVSGNPCIERTQPIPMEKRKDEDL
jgi:hypothetical protein